MTPDENDPAFVWQTAEVRWHDGGYRLSVDLSTPISDRLQYMLDHEIDALLLKLLPLTDGSRRNPVCVVQETEVWIDADLLFQCDPTMLRVNLDRVLTQVCGMLRQTVQWEATTGAEWVAQLQGDSPS
jgi:hypothetical protein